MKLSTHSNSAQRRLFNYYPFGSELIGSSYTISTGRNGFNGQEMERILDLSDYEFRSLNSKIGRWLSVDVLYQKYPNLSGYNFAVNSPIFFSDREGKDIICMITFTDETGKYTEHTFLTIQSSYDATLRIPANTLASNSIGSLIVNDLKDRSSYIYSENDEYAKGIYSLYSNTEADANLLSINVSGALAIAGSAGIDFVKINHSQNASDEVFGIYFTVGIGVGFGVNLRLPTNINQTFSGLAMAIDFKEENAIREKSGPLSLKTFTGWSYASSVSYEAGITQLTSYISDNTNGDASGANFIGQGTEEDVSYSGIGFTVGKGFTRIAQYSFLAVQFGGDTEVEVKSDLCTPVSNPSGTDTTGNSSPNPLNIQRPSNW